jgi:hypothetical protein
VHHLYINLIIASIAAADYSFFSPPEKLNEFRQQFSWMLTAALHSMLLYDCWQFQHLMIPFIYFLFVHYFM